MHGVCPENNFRTPFSHYGQTLGVGYYEYFLLCECLGAKPLPVVSVGIACQYMSTQFVPLDDPALEVYIQEALDLVEFANGGADTVWGRVRAEMGHPKPFGLEYLGVGNEQWEDNSEIARKRFELFEKRIHEKYPTLKIIGTVGPTVDNPFAQERVGVDEGKSCKESRFRVRLGRTLLRFARVAVSARGHV